MINHKLGIEQDVSIHDDNSGSNTQISPLGNLKIALPIRLTGGKFEGGVFNNNFWTATTSSGGTTALQNNVLVMSTSSISSNGRCFVTFNKKARALAAYSNDIMIGAKFGDTGVANNIRRLGLFNSTDGFFFELSGTTFSLVTRKGAIDTAITGFNGNVRPVVDTNFHYYRIEYLCYKLFFYQDGELIHKTTNCATTLTNTLDLKIAFENLNINSLSSAQTLQIISAGVIRSGEQSITPFYVNSISAETKTLKSTPGTLHEVVINRKGSGGAILSLWDSSSAGGQSIAVIDTTVNVGNLNYHLDFDNGLTYQTSSNNIGDVTIIYD
jgi:hypothetical protein